MCIRDRLTARQRAGAALVIRLAARAIQREGAIEGQRAHGLDVGADRQQHARDVRVPVSYTHLDVYKRQLEYMFIMMNSARLSVGVQGVGISELALQQASAWARSRVQGRAPGAQGDASAPIVQHPDVARMLLTIRCV